MKWRFLCLLVPALAVARPPAPSVPVCARCHVEETRFETADSMAHALETIEDCKTLTTHPLLTTKLAGYSYRIERHGSKSIYTVSDGTRSLSLEIKWAMGASSAIGQTYILERDGQLYESRVSYFQELNGLRRTLGNAGVHPDNLIDAAGRLMGQDDKLACFGCHATNAVKGRQLTLETMIPGVRCERCHGPAEAHAAAMIAGKADSVPMKDLSAMSTEDISSFCGQCHRTWEEVVLSGRLDITDLRFQPYRLAGSKCYDASDPRISCLACHDPHRNADTKPADYDAKCLACHNGGKPGAKMCTVATHNCVTCHMPRIELPGGHHMFSDHRIRIVHHGEPFPG